MGWSKDHGTAAKVNAEYAKEQGNVAKQEATNLAELKLNVEAATQNASTAAENANAVIVDANTAASNADSAASEAIAQANHAKNEGDRAKAEADRLAGTDVSLLDNKIGSLSSLNTTNKTSVVGSVNEVAQQLAQKANEADVRLKTVKLSQTDMAEEFLQQMTGTTPINAVPPINGVTNAMLAPKVVTEDKINFVTMSSNLYNHETVIAGKSISSISGLLIDNTAYKSTDFIAVTPATQYTVIRFNRVIYYDANKSKLSFADFANPNIANSIQIPANCYYMRLHGLNGDMNNKPQINKGNVLLSYEPYYAKISQSFIQELDGQKITSGIAKEALNFIGMSSNIYNSKKATNDYSLSSTTGQPVANASYFYSDFIKIDATKKYVSKGFNRALYYNSDKTYLGYLDVVEGTIISPVANTQYIRLHGFKTTKDTAQFNQGETLLAHEPYYLTFDGIKLLENANSEIKAKTYYFPPEDINGDYTAKESIYTPFELEGLYTAYDLLVLNNPKYFTKTLLGKDASNTYDIFKYHLKPQGASANIDKVLPKMVFLHNIHGHEKSATFAMYYLVKAMCEDWMDDPILEYLRFNVEFVFIPVLNPWGFVNDEYKNANGVNIQVNFPVSFDTAGDRGNPSSPIYAGTAPLSEVETQYAKQLIDENKDAIHFISFHTQDFSDLSTEPLFYSQLNSGEYYHKEIEYVAKYATEKITRLYLKNYGIDMGLLGEVVRRVGRGTEDIYAASVGIAPVINEHFYRLPNETNFYSSDCLKANTELLANWIIIALKRFKDIY